MKKAISLLSGGLDSVVSTFKAMENFDLRLCLFFDYGQKALNKELEAATFYSDLMGVKLEIIKLDFLKKITVTALVNEQLPPHMTLEALEDPEFVRQSALAVWVPNRNGLFVNIAGCYCDSMDINNVITGFNFEEASTFSDNSIEFIDAINNSLKYSTSNSCKVVSPFCNNSKSVIVKEAIHLNIDLSKIFSCYNNDEKQCGICESCIRLKKALSDNDIDYSKWFLI
ncbi:MAG: 7-cyano-7-deazaguanine synthase QueC [Candidatus Muiribacterium halophilum]|uniref:7-cyano-7-deazaguanine synthase n=1 Tax=Muiribacterium halophilum TaxID=2053465 RepID=A0A2N5ZI83_MUIH1|nr:MAG: 7-cyano-7-deazaguanine synthase QueC [Candidatus Muirbacterium halophilum]